MRSQSTTNFLEATDPLNEVGTVAELFAGVGGFRIGLNKSGWKTVFSNQWEPSTKSVQHASAVYVERFGESGHTNEDISKVLDNPDVIPQTTMLVGGFPCQDYSVAKSLSASGGIEGKKGVLWWQILRFIQLKEHPPIIFLENVDRLLSSPSTQRGRDFAIMLRSLAIEGYFVEWRVVNAADYGFPQKRKRVYIVAKHRKFFEAPSKEDFENFLLEKSVLARSLPVDQILEKKGRSANKLKGSLLEITETYDLGEAKTPFLNAGILAGEDYLSVAVEACKAHPSNLGDVVEKDSSLVPQEFFVDAKSEVFAKFKDLKDGGARPRKTKEGFEYFYTEGAMAFPDSLSKPARTILTGEGGTTPSRFKHLIQTPDGLYRRLLPEELEKLNGFPPGWTKSGQGIPNLPAARRAFLMGNALVVGIIALIGTELAKDWLKVKFDVGAKD